MTDAANDRSEALFHVPPEWSKETLAAALRRWMPGKSWNDVRKLIDSRHVSVCGNLCLDPSRRLNPGDAVHVFARPQLPPPKSEDIRVVHCDDDVVVVEKPSGMTTIRHPEERNWPARRRQSQPTLDELMPRVVARYEGRRREKAPLPRIRAVHRLDRDTSGLMIFARTEEAERGLGKQFRDHTIHRRYLALALGRVETQTIESHLILNRGDGRRGSAAIPNVGQHAVTHVRPVEFFDGFTLVECRLETGRTHQIRIHLSEKGHPVAGDKVYHTPLHGSPIADRSGAPRLALHAAELGFEHPTTLETMSFHSPLPLDLAQFVERLRAARGG